MMERTEGITRRALLPHFSNSVYEAVAIRYLEHNHWRFKHTLGDWEDAVQEAAHCFYECRRLYGGKVENNKHFMALYKQVLFCWFTDWANWNTRVITAEAAYCATTNKLKQTVPSEASLLLTLREASKELTFVLGILFNCPKEFLSTLKLDSREHPAVFWKNVVKYCGIEDSLAPILESELRTLLK